MSGYQVTSNEVLEWVATGPDPDTVEAVLAAIPVLAKDPHSPPAMPVPGKPLPTYTWPVDGAYLAITYVVIEQLRAIRILHITRPAT